MVTRAQVKSHTAYAGRCPPSDVIDFKVDYDQVPLGGFLTGTVALRNHSKSSPSMAIPNIHSIQLVFEGWEYTVVALPPSKDNQMGLDYLKKHTSETHVLIQQEQTLALQQLPHEGSSSSSHSSLSSPMMLSSSQPQKFRFFIPENLPCTLKCTLDGTDPTLPSQCQIKYSLTASITKNGSSAHVCRNINVVPKESSNVPLDSSIAVTMKQSPFSDVFMKMLLSCTSNCSQYVLSEDEDDIDDDDDICDIDDYRDDKEMYDPVHHNSRRPTFESELDKDFVQLEASHETLCLAAGQFLKVEVRDWSLQNHCQSDSNSLLDYFQWNNSKSGSNATNMQQQQQEQKSVWMIQLVEELIWYAQGRMASSSQTWDLFANHHELPTNLRPSYDNSHRDDDDGDDGESLVSIFHTMTIYWKRPVRNNNNSKRNKKKIKHPPPKSRVVAMTLPISVRIVSNHRLWDI